MRQIRDHWIKKNQLCENLSRQTDNIKFGENTVFNFKDIVI